MLDRIQLIHSVSMDLGLGTEALEHQRNELGRRNEVVARQRIVHDREREGWDEHRRRCQQWRDLSWEERERLVLEVLGDEQATVSEVAAKLNTRFGWPAQRRRGDRGPHNIPPIDSGDARSVAMRLLDQGAVGRLNAPHKNRHAVWHFFCMEATTPTEAVA